MSANREATGQWKADIQASVDMYNQWFLKFAPKAFRDTRIEATIDVDKALKQSNFLSDISREIIEENSKFLSVLRMSTCPPIAVDRLIGLSGVDANFVKSIENNGRIPPRATEAQLQTNFHKVIRVIRLMLDPDIFSWVSEKRTPTEIETFRASTIIADRLCGSISNPIIRNAQEERQLLAIQKWLESHGYRKLDEFNKKPEDMPAGTFTFRHNVEVVPESGIRSVNIPVDVTIKKISGDATPLFIEAKSAGDFANVNKRRKEEAQKMSQLKNTFGRDVQFSLFLCGYFDSGYLGYEAAEGIDWVWEHRIEDLAKLGA